MLTLPIKKKWFDMILSGEKNEEYRKISPYYGDRFYPYTLKYKSEASGVWKQIPASIRFRNGYSSGSPSFVAICTIDIGEGRPEWGAEPGRRYYRLHIEHVIPENLGNAGGASPSPTKPIIHDREG